MNKFENVSQNFLVGLEKQNISEPTEIQTLAIPQILENKNVLIESCTGSGKTLAFLVPLFEKIDTTKRQNQILIIAPTHELVMQIHDQVKLLIKNSDSQITSISLIGGTNINKQIENLKKNKPHIIVGSAGRVFELIQKKKVTAHTLTSVVIDEADNLLGKNQRKDILGIFKAVMRDTQKILCTATLNKDLLKDAEEFLPNYVLLKTEVSVNRNIEHFTKVTDKRKKIDSLKTLINKENPERALVFINNTHEVDVITEKLRFHNLSANALSGSQTKQERSTALAQFRSGKANILVSSDISARGLDIPEITHIFNLDMPPQALDYVHRAGRTARGNNSGKAFSIITEQEQKIIKEYEKKLDIKFSSI